MSIRSKSYLNTPIIVHLGPNSTETAIFEVIRLAGQRFFPLDLLRGELFNLVLVITIRNPDKMPSKTTNNPLLAACNDINTVIISIGILVESPKPNIGRTVAEANGGGGIPVNVEELTNKLAEAGTFIILIVTDFPVVQFVKELVHGIGGTVPVQIDSRGDFTATGRK